ncbi:MAG TPA: biliverdin-producing heme oxygenase [Pseudomonadales bacterium]
MSYLLTELRRATGEIHARLHTHPALRNLTSDSLSIHDYGFSLQRFYGFYLNHERLYAASGHELLPHFPAGTNIGWLMDDLARLGIDVHTLPVLAVEETHFDRGQVLAYLYLREGSNLGGKVISASLQRSLGLRPGMDNRFYWGNGAAAGDRWKILRERLEACEASTDIAEAGRYAGVLFERLEAWLSLHEEAHA